MRSMLSLGTLLAWAAFLDADGHLAPDFGEDLRALRVGLFFFMHDVFPFGMSGHDGTSIFCKYVPYILSLPGRF